MQELEQKVKALYELVIQGATIEAMELFYDENVTMQENEQEPRVGKSYCIAYERQLLKKMPDFSARVVSQAIDPVRQIVFTELDIRFTTGENVLMRLQEVSVQQWQDGQVIREKFYYKDFYPVPQ